MEDIHAIRQEWRSVSRPFSLTQMQINAQLNQQQQYQISQPLPQQQLQLAQHQHTVQQDKQPTLNTDPSPP
jgi:hypothetical protein